MKRIFIFTNYLIIFFILCLFLAQVSEAISVPIPIPNKLIEKAESNQGILSIPIKKVEEVKEIEKGLRPWCKDLCGDGICQEITCMAIGCPCPETPQTCPQDCRGKRSSRPIKKVVGKRPIGMPNPAAVYCQKLGYKYEIRKNKKGEYGVCIFPDNSECNAWDFYKAKCGEKFSFCERQGFKIENRVRKIGNWKQEYAVCVFPDSSECFEEKFFKGLCGQEYLKNKEILKKEEPEREKLLPLVEFPAKKIIKINPKKESPLSVEEKPVEFGGFQPDILLKVKAKEKPVAVKIHIDRQRKLTEIKVKDKVSICKETIKFKENKIKIKTPKKEFEIEVLPDKAFEVAEKYIPEIKKSELKVEKETPLYEFEGVKRGRLLFIFPVETKIWSQIDAKTGKLQRIKGPWWNFLVF